jgi:Holliday junction resolvase RusA-like endonuclease
MVSAMSKYHAAMNRNLGIYTLEIPRWHPATVNQLLRSVRGRIRLKKLDRQMIWSYCRLQQIPPAQGKRRVTLTIVLAQHQRGADPDPDSYFKSLGDACVHAHLLINDSHLYVEWAPVKYERSPAGWGSRIMFEDVRA